MKIDSPEVDVNAQATAEYVIDERWVKTLPDDVLLHVWMTLTTDDINDSRACLIKAEMDLRGVDSHSTA